MSEKKRPILANGSSYIKKIYNLWKLMKIKTHNIKTFCLQVGQPLKERPEADIMTIFRKQL